MASEEEKPKKELNIGPLEYGQQQQLDNLLAEYKIGRASCRERV